MKPIKRPGTILLICGAILSTQLIFVGLPIVGAGALVSGCKNPQPSTQLTALKSLSSTHVAVDAAYTGYMSLVIDGKVGTNGVPSVTRDYRAFQLVYNAAVDTVGLDPNAPAPAAVEAAAAKFQTTLTVAKSK